MIIENIEFEKLDETNFHLLMEWKNRNKEFFFNKRDISMKQHIEWFDNFKKDENNLMFLIKYDSEYIGSIGARIIDSKWDIFNVMNINSFNKGMGIMSFSLHEIIKKIRLLKRLPVTAKVLNTNKNLNWYLKNNFIISDEFPKFFLIKYVK